MGRAGDGGELRHIGTMAACVFPEALREFDAHLLAIGRADRTRHAYRRELVNFYADHLYAEGLCLCSVGPGDIERYLASKRQQGSAFGDVARALKAYYRWRASRGEPDPTRHVRIPRPKLPPAPTLPDSEFRALVRAAFATGDARRGWTMLLLLATGARIGSLVEVEPDAVDVPGAWISFQSAKAGRTYGVPLSRMGLIAARHLLGICHASHSGKASYRLIGVGAARVRQWIHEAEQSAGIGRVWPHLLRHEFSNRVAAHGDPEAWRLAMGHADLSQWPRYVHAGEDRLRRIMP